MSNGLTMEPLLAMIAPIVTLIGGAFITFIVMRNREGSGRTTIVEQTETDRLLSLGFERAPVGIAYMGADGAWIHVNQRFLLLLGYERSDFYKTELRSLTHAEDRKREAAMMASLRAGRTRGFTINKRLRKGDGSYQSFRFSIARVGGGAHQVFECVIDEVSAEVEMQDGLVAVFDRVPEVAVVRLDPKGMIRSWNRGAEELYGFSAAEMRDKPWTRLHVATAGRSGQGTRELAIAASSGTFEGAASRRRNDDTTISVEIVIVPQFRGKDLTGFIEIARDATLGHSALEYKAAYERTKRLHEEKVRALSDANERLRRRIARHEEIEGTMREVQEKVRETNRELNGRIKVFSAAVRKLIDQRKELQETIRTERRERAAASEELTDALPEGLEWTPFDRSADRILGSHLESNRNGILVVRSGESEKRLTLRGGSIAACSSNSSGLLLGQLLVDEKKISETDRRKMIEVQDQTGIAFGRLLLLFELMSEGEIRDAVESKILRELNELEEWGQGEWTFFEKEIEPLQVVPVEVFPVLPDHDVEMPVSAVSDSFDTKDETDGSEQEVEPGRVEAPPKKREAEEGQARIVASRSARTTKYHLESCSSVARIPKKSRKRFNGRSAAEAAGLSPCKRCIEEVPTAVP